MTVAEPKESATEPEKEAKAQEAATSADAGTADQGAGEAGTLKRARAADRNGLLAGAAVLLACLGLVVYGVLNTSNTPDKPPAPTAQVTYEVTGKGSADLTYQARNETGKAVVVRGAALPWKKTVRVPLGKPPTIAITLGADGGEVRCELAIRGKHVQTATAFGNYGRATCQGELPAPEASPDGVK